MFFLEKLKIMFYLKYSSEYGGYTILKLFQEEKKYFNLFLK